MNKKSKEQLNSKPIYHFFKPTKKIDEISIGDFYDQNLPQQTNNTENILQVEHQPLQISIENELLRTDVEQQPLDLSTENELLKKENAELKLEIQKLREESKKFRIDLSDLNKFNSAVCRRMVRTEMRIDLLSKNESNQGKQGLIHDRYKNVFGEGVLKDLRKLSGCKRSDSTFIHKTMQSLYKNTDILKSRSASGTGGKTVISPEKRKVIDGIFLERISAEVLTDKEVDSRLLRVNKLINSAINNILKVRN